MSTPILISLAEIGATVILQARPFDATSDAATVLNGLESFTLAYKVDWPLNVVLSKATLTKYRCGISY